MKSLKLLVLSLMVLFNVAHAASNMSGTFGMHLFFDEREFIDVLTFSQNDKGEVTGHMFVPDDFEGNIEAVTVTGSYVKFDLFVPKNRSRPEDLVFTYHLYFVGKKFDQFHGYVTLKGETDFVASFVGFRRPNK